MISMMTIKGGGGGGGGFTRAAGAAGGGGGSGACSGIDRLVIPAFLVPDLLFVFVGAGGAGGAASAAGLMGGQTFISTSRRTTVQNCFLGSNNTAPGLGGAGTGAVGGAAGAVPGIGGVTTLSALGVTAFTVGVVGIIGGAQTGAAGGNPTVWAALPLSAGASGAGCTTTDFNGGLINVGADTEWCEYQGINAATQVPGGVGGTSVNVNGGGGLSFWKPFFQTGGSGGGSNNAGQAGHGGRGGIGCGGGGGGAGTTGGRGGSGGDGLAMIISW